MIINNQLIILLVDDDLEDQDFFQMAVSGISPCIKLKIADSGVSAIEKLRVDNDFVPDFIFLDINMPLMNGQECLREIKKLEKIKDTPVYMFTTSADDSISKSCRSLGAFGVIQKIPSIDTLSEKLRSIFMQHRVLSV